MSLERRRHPRFSPTQWVVRVRDAGSFHIPILEDISVGGLRVATKRPMTVGSQIDLDLLLPDGASPVPLRGKVIRVLDATLARMARMVIELTTLHPASEQRLNHLLAKLAAAMPHVLAGDGERTQALQKELEQARAQLGKSQQDLSELRDETQQLLRQLSGQLQALAAERAGRLAAEERVAKLQAALERLSTPTPAQVLSPRAVLTQLPVDLRLATGDATAVSASSAGSATVTLSPGQEAEEGEEFASAVVDALASTFVSDDDSHQLL